MAGDLPQVKGPKYRVEMFIIDAKMTDVSRQLDVLKALQAYGSFSAMRLQLDTDEVDFESATRLGRAPVESEATAYWAVRYAEYPDGSRVINSTVPPLFMPEILEYMDREKSLMFVDYLDSFCGRGEGSQPFFAAEVKDMRIQNLRVRTQDT